jgi:hypothetical protein
MTRVYKTLGKRLNGNGKRLRFRIIGSALGHTGQTSEGHWSDWCHPEQSQLLTHSICVALNLRFGLDKHETT